MAGIDVCNLPLGARWRLVGVLLPILGAGKASPPRPALRLVRAALAVPADDGVKGAGGDGVEDLRDQRGMLKKKATILHWRGDLTLANDTATQYLELRTQYESQRV